MNVTDAIKTLTKAKKVHSQRAGLDFIKSLDMAISALEKQIPKKCRLFKGTCFCPNCKRLFGKYENLKTFIQNVMPYCKHCGQALDWSDSE